MNGITRLTTLIIVAAAGLMAEPIPLPTPYPLLPTYKKIEYNLKRYARRVKKRAVDLSSNKAVQITTAGGVIIVLALAVRAGLTKKALSDDPSDQRSSDSKDPALDEQPNEQNGIVPGDSPITKAAFQSKEHAQLLANRPHREKIDAPLTSNADAEDTPQNGSVSSFVRSEDTSSNIDGVITDIKQNPNAAGKVSPRPGVTEDTFKAPEANSSLSPSKRQDSLQMDSLLVGILPDADTIDENSLAAMGLPGFN